MPQSFAKTSRGEQHQDRAQRKSNGEKNPRRAPRRGVITSTRRTLIHHNDGEHGMPNAKKRHHRYVATKAPEQTNYQNGKDGQADKQNQQRTDRPRNREPHTRRECGNQSAPRQAEPRRADRD